MTDDPTSPETDRLRAAHAEIPAPDATTVAAARERLRRATASEGRDPVASRRRRWMPGSGSGLGVPATGPDGAGAPRGWGRIVPRAGRRSVVAGAVVLAGAVVVVAATGVGGGGVDVVARAEAALTRGGPVVHLVVRGGAVQPDGTPLMTGVASGGRIDGRRSGRTESWATDRPLRFVVRQAVVGPDGEARGYERSGLTAGGLFWELDADGGGPPPRTDLRDGEARGVAESATNGLGADPTARIRRMLSNGAFRSDGETTVDGRRARRLVAETTADDGTLARRTVYLVDAGTFRPLDLRVYEGAGATAAVTVKQDPTRSGPAATTEASPTTTTAAPPAGGRPSAGTERLAREARRTLDAARARRAGAAGPVLVQHVVVERFERLPLDDRTARLFVPPAEVGRIIRRSGTTGP